MRLSKISYRVTPASQSVSPAHVADFHITFLLICPLFQPLPRPPSPSRSPPQSQGQFVSDGRILDDLRSEVSSNGDLADVYALGWPDVPHTPITPSTPTASFLPTIPCLRIGSSDVMDDLDVLTSTIRPRSSSLALTSFFSTPDLRSGVKSRPALPFPHLLNTSTVENNARDSEPNTPTTLTSFLSTSSDGVSPVPFEFSDGSGSTFASPSTSPSRSRNESRSCSYEQFRDERPLPPTPWVLIDRCDEEEERDNRTPTPGPGFFAKQSHYGGRDETREEQELNLPPSRFSLCSSAGTPCKASGFPTANQATTSTSSRFGLSKVRKAVKMPSKSNLKLNTSPTKEKDRSRRISGISARTAHTTHTNYTATTSRTGTSFAASSTFSSFVSTKSSSGFGSRIKRLLGVTVKDLNALPPMPSMPPSPTFAPNYASAHTPAPSLRRTHASMPSIDKNHLSPVRTALSNLPSFKEKKRLVIRLIASSDDAYAMGRLSPSQEERAFECIREWCSVRSS